MILAVIVTWTISIVLVLAFLAHSYEHERDHQP